MSQKSEKETEVLTKFAEATGLCPIWCTHCKTYCIACTECRNLTCASCDCPSMSLWVELLHRRLNEADGFGGDASASVASPMQKIISHYHVGPERDCAECGEDLTHPAHRRAE